MSTTSDQTKNHAQDPSWRLFAGTATRSQHAEIVRYGQQRLIVQELVALLGAERQGCSQECLGGRSDDRPPLLISQLADIHLWLLKLRLHRLLLSIPELLPRADAVVDAVVMEACVGGESFRGDFIGSFQECGLPGVQLVVSDAHKGVTNAIRWMLQGF